MKGGAITFLPACLILLTKTQKNASSPPPPPRQAENTLKNVPPLSRPRPLGLKTMVGGAARQKKEDPHSRGV